MNDRELQLEAAQVEDPQLREARLEQGDHPDADEQGAQPLVHPLDQDLVHEELRGDRQCDARHHQEEARQHAVREVPVRAREAAAQGPDGARLPAALHEVVAGL
ncbi:hypothetical protein D3C86_1201420 [compost metagenome]